MTDPINKQITDERLLPLLEVTELLRTFDREFPAQMMSVFFYVATHNGCHKLAVEEELNMQTASSSRCLTALSEKHRIKGKKGYGLVELLRDPGDARRLRCYLTPAGEALAKHLHFLITSKEHSFK